MSDKKYTSKLKPRKAKAIRNELQTGNSRAIASYKKGRVMADRARRGRSHD